MIEATPRKSQGRRRDPGTDVFLGRNLLLVVLWGLMLTLPSAGKPAENPVTERGGAR